MLNIDTPDKSPAPFFSQAISNSHYFSKSYTPLARTFPSIMSSITGLYPKNSKAEFNLTNPKYFTDIKMLPQILKQHNYHTIHATDERRFANFTNIHGFDTVLGPPEGILDFLLGKFSDIPVLNLVTLLPYSELLLPHSSINRAAHYAYNPKKFTNYLTRSLARDIQNFSNQPAFIFIHLCLPHYPYSWSNSNKGLSSSQNYKNAISEADNQAKDLHKFLSDSGIINEHSIQIYMSDHGESLHDDKVEFILPDGSKINLYKPGHGTDIRDINQNHIALAFQHTSLKPKTDSILAATIDLTPSLLSLLELPPTQVFDGINLFSKDKDIINRKIELETGFNIKAILQKKINNSEVFNQGKYAYKITSTGKVIIKDTSFKQLIKKKQHGSWNGSILTTKEDSKVVNYDWANKTVSFQDPP
jgi:arylsulfatase A-like enzyme